MVTANPVLEAIKMLEISGVIIDAPEYPVFCDGEASFILYSERKWVQTVVVKDREPDVYRMHVEVEEMFITRNRRAPLKR